ncbi:hypothetical protein [Methyloceanibacter marginalis]|uniref:hypothetical protein n=1 Tax=Methyloceanibacter marginalis TaxID=1774971 RepID=UPI001301708A|nr:hypothetical protein [Methyloceanibacter marginalis]
MDEVSAAMKLEDLRRQSGQLKDISFDTISASGPHGAWCITGRRTLPNACSTRTRSI